MKRLLITGASGFIGRHCLVPLIERGYEVHAAARHPLTDAREVIWHATDLLTPGAAADLARRVRATHLLHMAWYTKHGLYWTAPENSNWLYASIDLLDVFTRAGGERAICAGSCAEYAWNNVVCDECRTPLNPQTPYGRTKVDLYNRLELLARERHLSLGWGCIFFPYGPYEAAERLVPRVINSLLRREPVKCTSGERQFDYLYVEDVADAFVALLASDVTGPVNIASGLATRVRDVVMTVAHLLDGHDLVHLGALPQGENDPGLLMACVERLKRRSGGCHRGLWPQASQPQSIGGVAGRVLLFYLRECQRRPALFPGSDLPAHLLQEDLRTGSSVDLPVTIVRDGYDITSYRLAAEYLKGRYRSLCFLNTHSILLDEHWLQKLFASIQRPGVGLAGATASFESIYSVNLVAARAAFRRQFYRWICRQLHLQVLRLQFPPFPNGHLRTNAFLISTSVMSKIWIKKVRSKMEAMRFESGYDLLTRRVLRAKLRVVVVGRDGNSYEMQDWPHSATFRSGEQLNLLVAES
jgi:nucleoside-diphosphate-sugar epimerase